MAKDIVFPIFFLFLLLHLSYGDIISISFSKNNTFINGKLDIIDRSSKLNIKNHEINTGFHIQWENEIPFVPDIRFEYIPYSYKASGKVELQLLDVLENANFPVLFGTQNIVTDDFKFGDFDIFDFFGKNDTVDMDIYVNIKEYNFTLFYQLFKDSKVSPKYGVYIKYISSSVNRKIKTEFKDLKDSSTGSKIVPFLFLGLDINIPFSGLNLLFKTSTEGKLLKYKETIYYNLEISETIHFTDIKYLSNVFFSVGYRHWRLKTDYKKDKYKVTQRLRWNMPYLLLGIKF